MPAAPSRKKKSSTPNSLDSAHCSGRVRAFFRASNGRFISARLVSNEGTGASLTTASTSGPQTHDRSGSLPPPVPVGYMPETGQPIYSLVDSNRIARENMPPPPSEWPRTDWKGVCFGIPNYSDCPGVGLGEIYWGCKNGTVAVVKALGSGDWSFIKEPATAILLAICDKVMLLNDYYRDVHCVMGCLNTYQAWEDERNRDIESTFKLAVSKVPLALNLSTLSQEKVAQAAFACLHADFQFHADALAVLPHDKTITFQRPWFGEFSPKTSDLVAYGSFVLRRRINMRNKDFLDEALDAAEEHEAKYGPPSDVTVTNPLNVLPPTQIPPTQVPIEYAACKDVEILIPTADGELQPWTHDS